MFSFFSKCIHLLNWFDYRNHICLVSELLGMCVYDFLKENDFTPFPRDHIQSFAQQLLGSVACMCFTPVDVLTPNIVFITQSCMIYTSSTQISNQRIFF